MPLSRPREPIDDNDRPIPFLVTERVHPIDDLVVEFDVGHMHDYRM